MNFLNLCFGNGSYPDVCVIWRKVHFFNKYQSKQIKQKLTHMLSLVSKSTNSTFHFLKLSVLRNAFCLFSFCFNYILTWGTTFMKWIWFPIVIIQFYLVDDTIIPAPPLFACRNDLLFVFINNFTALIMFGAFCF
jgi:hypothetical protein